VPSAPPRTRSPSPTEGFTVPNELLCPITSLIFRDPVVATDGHTYEREAITQWLQQRRVSPMTREPLSLDKIIPNRVVKKMVDDFIAECRRKRLLYKYKLDVDVKKTEQVPYIKTNTKSLYQAEWLNNNSSSTASNIILMHLTGENAEKIAESNCRLESHSNIVRVFGRVEHNDTGILLVQEHPSPQTLSQLIKNPDPKLSITHLDFILYQISSALQHLANAEIIHGNITADNVFIYHLDEVPKNTLVKLNTIGHMENDINIHTIPPEVLSRNSHSEKSDVYTFGILAREMCLLEIETNEEGLLERQALYERCLVVDPNDRPTFNELTKAILDFIREEMCILECSSSV
jgi:serine/threonine protein kinase